MPNFLGLLGFLQGILSKRHIKKYAADGIPVLLADFQQRRFHMQQFRLSHDGCGTLLALDFGENFPGREVANVIQVPVVPRCLQTAVSGLGSGKKISRIESLGYLKALGG